MSDHAFSSCLFVAGNGRGAVSLFAYRIRRFCFSHKGQALKSDFNLSGFSSGRQIDIRRSNLNLTEINLKRF